MEKTRHEKQPQPQRPARQPFRRNDDQKMGEALAKSGRPIVFSLCEYGLGGVEKWGPEVGGNLWRTTGDIRDEWSSMIEDAEKQSSRWRMAERRLGFSTMGARPRKGRSS